MQHRIRYSFSMSNIETLDIPQCCPLSMAALMKQYFVLSAKTESKRRLSHKTSSLHS